VRDLSKEDEEDDLAGKDEEREATDGDADESGLPPSAPGGGQEGENPKHEAKDGRACAANGNGMATRPQIPRTTERIAPSRAARRSLVLM
jgi:hypothetical protein